MSTRLGLRFLVLAGGVVLAGGCAAEPTPGDGVPPAAGPEQAGDAATPAGDDAMTAQADAPQALAPGRPVTVRLPLSADLLAAVRRHVETAGAPTLRLTLEGLATPKVPVSVRVFLNHAAATAETPLDDPRYLGDVGFFPTGDYGGAGSPPRDSSFLLDAGSALAELAPAERVVDERYVDVTLIAVPLDESAAGPAADVEIAFEGVRLEAHEGAASPSEPPAVH